MFFATHSQAVPIYFLGGGILLGAAFLAWTVDALARDGRNNAVVGWISGTVAAVIAVFGLLVGGFVLEVASATAHCPPDAYECPF